MTSVRYATPADATTVADVHSTAARELGADHYTDEQLDHWCRERAPDEYDFDEGVHVVAERDDDVVAWGCVLPERAELRAIYVHPDHAREGVGSAVLDRLEREAVDSGCSALCLWAALPGVAFYDANGYDRVRRVDLDYGPVTLPVVVMRKRALTPESVTLKPPG